MNPQIKKFRTVLKQLGVTEPLSGRFPLCLVSGNGKRGRIIFARIRPLLPAERAKLKELMPNAVYRQYSQPLDYDWFAVIELELK